VSAKASVTREEVFAKIKKIAQDHFSEPFDNATDAMPVRDGCIPDLNLDSLDTIEMVMKIEDAFNIEISDDKIDNLRSFGPFVDLVTNLVNA
jgi:acyl carrier protein